MTVPKFGSGDLKLFIGILLLLHVPPLLMLIPVLGALAFLPWLFWINIPGIPMAALGVPFFDIQEFGAVPKGGLAWLLIVLFWVAVAFCLTLVIKRVRMR